jgi:protein-disulfide isomerase
MHPKTSPKAAALLVSLHLVLSACVKHPAPVTGRVTPASKSAAVAHAAPVPTSYACPSIGAAVQDDAERVCVPYAGTPKGDAQAPITVVEFSDFECPYCARVQATLSKLEQTYPGKLRFYFRHEPLPFHAKARLAAQAAVAAENQGRFGPMHDRLFAHQTELGRQDLIRHAQALGLDPERFLKDLEAPETRERIDEDVKLADALAVRGTPIFFINGRSVRGAVPFEEFRKVIDDELQRAQKMGLQAASGYSFYAALMEGKGKGLGEPATPVAPTKIPVGNEVFNIEVGSAPQKGPVDAPVTLVVFSDFQCPFCSRLDAILDEVTKAYPGKLRIVWKNFPLAFHARARATAEAALAAHEQGKFWPMQAKLLDKQNALDDADLEDYAREIGLDMVRFKAAMGSHKFAAAVEADVRQGTSLGVVGTPTTFVNGTLISGAEAPKVFRARIDQELAKAAAK